MKTFSLFTTVVFCIHLTKTNAINRFVLNENDLQINVISQNYNFFQRVLISNQYQITSFFPKGDEILDIICKKLTPGLDYGVPQVYINSIRLNQTNRCFSCLEQKYFFNTSTLIKDFKYDIECRLEVGEARVKTTFYKIYTDSMPRIRNGTQLLKYGNIIVHTINEKSLSCEAVKDSSVETLSYPFDSISWFDDNNQNLFFPFTIIGLNDKIQNFSTLFDHFSPKVIHNKMYKCCTSLLGRLVQCQNIYVIKQKEAESTTKTITTETNSQHLNVTHVPSQLQKLIPPGSANSLALKATGVNFLFLGLSFFLSFFFI